MNQQQQGKMVKEQPIKVDFELDDFPASMDHLYKALEWIKEIEKHGLHADEGIGYQKSELSRLIWVMIQRLKRIQLAVFKREKPENEKGKKLNGLIEDITSVFVDHLFKTNAPLPLRMVEPKFWVPMRHLKSGWERYPKPKAMKNVCEAYKIYNLRSFEHLSLNDLKKIDGIGISKAMGIASYLQGLGIQLKS